MGLSAGAIIKVMSIIVYIVV